MALPGRPGASSKLSILALANPRRRRRGDRAVSNQLATIQALLRQSHGAGQTIDDDALGDLRVQQRSEMVRVEFAIQGRSSPFIAGLDTFLCVPEKPSISALSGCR